MLGVTGSDKGDVECHLFEQQCTPSAKATRKGSLMELSGKLSLKR